MKAALKLRSDLRSAISEYPSAKHIVITHSHGGNVALYALKDRELRSRVGGVVTMATPFILVAPRRLEWLAWITAIGAAVNLAFWPIVVAIRVAVLGFMRAVGAPETPDASTLESLMRFGGRILFTLSFAASGLTLGGKAAELPIRHAKRWVRRNLRRAVRCYPRLVYPGFHVLNLQVSP